MQMSKLMKRMDKKGQLTLGDLPGVVRAIIVVGVFLVVGAIVMKNIDDTTTAGTNEDNAVKNVSTSILNIATNMPLVGTIVGLVIVLGIVLLIGIRG